MWIVTDEAMRGLLGGEFCQVVIAKQHDPKMSMRKLYNYQFNYFSYAGFRKFFKSKLISILNSIRYIDCDSFVSKLLGWVFGLNEKNK